MKRPMNRNSRVGMNRVADWVATFSGYRHTVNEERIDRWRQQFKSADRDLAARLLDCVDFIGSEQIDTAYRSLLAKVPGWDKRSTKRKGRWVFAPYSKSAGESGDAMLHKFRIANQLTHNRYNNLFKHKSEIPSLRLSSDDTIVFVDDFSGTGDQACDIWNNHVQELLGYGPKLYLLLVAASPQATQRISTETSLVLMNEHLLVDADNFFSKECSHFNKSEKEAVQKYCKRVAKSHPSGYGDCGFLLVFAHRAPNNTIPILHISTEQWKGLFLRS